MKLFLSWLRDYPAVAGIDKEPKAAFKIGKREFFFRSPFTTYWPNGPSPEAYKYHTFLKHHLKFFTCKACGAGVWGWGQQVYCGSFSCFKKLFGGK